MEDKIIEGLAYTLPALATGFVAYLVLSKFLEQDSNEQKFNALVEKKHESLPLKLQAYERLLLFCERINLSKLLVRITPIGNEVDAYAKLLKANIEQEFEHNMVQQIYISDESWKAILMAKNVIFTKINKAVENSKSAQEFRENVLIDASQTESATDVAVQFIKREVKKLI